MGIAWLNIYKSIYMHVFTPLILHNNPHSHPSARLHCAHLSYTYYQTNICTPENKAHLINYSCCFIFQVHMPCRFSLESSIWPIKAWTIWKVLSVCVHWGLRDGMLSLLSLVARLGTADKSLPEPMMIWRIYASLGLELLMHQLPTKTCVLFNSGMILTV